MPNKGKFIGSQDNLFVPDAPTIGTATAGNTQVSVAFTAPSDVGGDAVTLYGASVFLAGATINYKVSVGTGTLSTGGSGNVYFIDGIPTKQLSLIKGFTYVFDLSDGSNSGHPFGFKNASDGAYTTGVTTSGTAGNASATVTLVLATDASEPSSYYCTSHGNGMGNTISLIEASASTDPLGAAQAGTTGSSSPITVTGLSNGTSYIAQVWAINDYGNGPLSAATASFSPVAPAKAAIFGGQDSSDTIEDSIQVITISSAGNATDFGNLSAATVKVNKGCAGNLTRSIRSGGQTTLVDSGAIDVIEFVNLNSAGNATDFGNLDIARFAGMQVSSDTRAVMGGGQNNSGVDLQSLRYITIASTGDTTSFGDLTHTAGNSSALASSTRGIFQIQQAAQVDFITIASTGNGADFGDASADAHQAAASNGTRGIFAGGNNNNVIEYFTIASAGNATDFGDLTVARDRLSGVGGDTKGVFMGGLSSSTDINTIDIVTISSTGNAQDFGDLTLSLGIYNTGSAGSAHGGLV